MTSPQLSWALLLGAGALLWSVLSLDDASQAAPQPGRQPFGNAVEQRNEMIRSLEQIKSLLEEQNRLLRIQVSPPDDKRLPRQQFPSVR